MAAKRTSSIPRKAPVASGFSEARFAQLETQLARLTMQQRRRGSRSTVAGGMRKVARGVTRSTGKAFAALSRARSKLNPNIKKGIIAAVAGLFGAGMGLVLDKLGVNWTYQGGAFLAVGVAMMAFGQVGGGLAFIGGAALTLGDELIKWFNGRYADKPNTSAPPPRPN